jgi:hypothetical protein
MWAAVQDNSETDLILATTVLIVYCMFAAQRQPPGGFAAHQLKDRLREQVCPFHPVKLEAMPIPSRETDSMGTIFHIPQAVFPDLTEIGPSSRICPGIMPCVPAVVQVVVS